MNALGREILMNQKEMYLHFLEDLGMNQQHEEREVRRSTRHRTEPGRLTYCTIGNPLTLVMQFLLKGLDLAFTKALDLEPAYKLTPLELKQLTTV